MDYLSFIKIKKSKVSGNGVFATMNIKKGKTICFFDGEEISLQEMSDRVDAGLERGSDPLQIGDEVYLDLDELSRSFNHSCNPNSFIRGKNELVALKNIKQGEEITYDYSTTMSDNEEKINATGSVLWTCKCKCLSKNCRGIVDQFKTIPKSRMNFYLKNNLVPDFILRKFKK